MTDLLPVINAALIIASTLISWRDRQRLRREIAESQPITLNLQVTVDPSMKKPPLVNVGAFTQAPPPTE